MVDLTTIFSDGFTTKSNTDLLPSDAVRPTINDSVVVKLAEYFKLDIEKGPWLAGGAVLKSYLGQPMGLSDLDIWFANRAQFEQVQKLVSDLGCSRVYSTENADSYKYYSLDLGTYSIQLIKRKFFDKPEQIINQFDFTVCQLVTDGIRTIVGPTTIPDIRARRLQLSRGLVAESVIPRMIKYMVYGYRPTPELLEEIEAQQSKINWTKPHMEYDAV